MSPIHCHDMAFTLAVAYTLSQMTFKLSILSHFYAFTLMSSFVKY